MDTTLLLFVSQHMGETCLTDLLSHTGTEDHVPFMHSAVASLSLSSYPSSHIIRIFSPFSYQPFLFSVYFALGIVGGMQAFSSEKEKKKNRKTFLN